MLSCYQKYLVCRGVGGERDREEEEVREEQKNNLLGFVFREDYCSSGFVGGNLHPSFWPARKPQR